MKAKVFYLVLLFLISSHSYANKGGSLFEGELVGIFPAISASESRFFINEDESSELSPTQSPTLKKTAKKIFPKYRDNYFSGSSNKKYLLKVKFLNITGRCITRYHKNESKRYGLMTMKSGFSLAATAEITTIQVKPKKEKINVVEIPVRARGYDSFDNYDCNNGIAALYDKALVYALELNELIYMAQNGDSKDFIKGKLNKIESEMDSDGQGILASSLESAFSLAGSIVVNSVHGAADTGKFIASNPELVSQSVQAFASTSGELSREQRSYGYQLAAGIQQAENSNAAQQYQAKRSLDDGAGKSCDALINTLSSRMRCGLHGVASYEYCLTLDRSAPSHCTRQCSDQFQSMLANLDCSIKPSQGGQRGKAVRN